MRRGDAIGGRWGILLSDAVHHTPRANARYRRYDTEYPGGHTASATHAPTLNTPLALLTEGKGGVGDMHRGAPPH